MSGKKEKSEKKDKTNDVDDHISKRYEMKKRLGKGVSTGISKEFLSFLKNRRLSFYA